VAIALGGASVLAQGAKTAGDEKPAAPASSESRRYSGKVTIYSDGGLTGKAPLFQLKKNVRLTQEGEDFILYADQLTYNEDQDKAVATANLRVESRDSTITGDSIVAYFNKKEIVITGHVVIMSHGTGDGIKASAPATGTPRPDATGDRSLRSQAKRKPSRITCDRVVYNYQNHEAEAVGNILMTQDKKSGTCAKIVYDEENNIAHLIGNVRFTDEEKREATMPELYVYIDANQWETKLRTVITMPHPNRTQAAVNNKTKMPEMTTIPADAVPDDTTAASPPASPSPADKSNGATEPAKAAADGTPAAGNVNDPQQPVAAEAVKTAARG
jgi:lipopolysaccharide assembly outer membrane protein LptD (OstA)